MSETLRRINEIKVDQRQIYKSQSDRLRQLDPETSPVLRASALDKREKAALICEAIAHYERAIAAGMIQSRRFIDV